jgi:hypothetical protein
MVDHRHAVDTHIPKTADERRLEWSIPETRSTPFKSLVIFQYRTYLPIQTTSSVLRAVDPGEDKCSTEYRPASTISSVCLPCLFISELIVFRVIHLVT